MKLSKLFVVMLLAASVSLVACKKEEGPMEKMGKSIDKAAHDVEKNVKKAEKKAKKAIKDMED